jgi:thiamine biosynthesis lipoprotein
MKIKNFVQILIIAHLLALFVFVMNRNVNIPQQQTFYAMGTNLTITIAEKNFDEKVFEKAFNAFKKVETQFKDNLDFSDPDVKFVLNKGLNLQKQTQGAFSIYLSEVIKLWQFDKTNKTISKAPTKQQLEKALQSKTINLYAIAKGYGIDKVAETLKQSNINNFIINAGGDIYVSGSKFGNKWKIGINDSTKYLTCDLPEYALATSSNLYNYYTFEEKKYGHLINGVTGMPTQANKSITVLAKTATDADGLATAIFVDESLIFDNLTDYFSVFKQENGQLSSFNENHKCKILD